MSQRSTAYRIEYSPVAEDHLMYLTKHQQTRILNVVDVNSHMSRRSKHAIERRCAPIPLVLGNFASVIFGCIMTWKKGHENWLRF